MPIDTDMVAMLFGPFGDVYRRDKRSPFVTEGYVDIHPLDAKDLGSRTAITWDRFDPEDRPFRGWQKNAKDYQFARLLCRARYYPGTPRGVTRMWFNMYGTTPGSQEGQKIRKDGLAKNPRTQYQAMFRSGSHQSATRGWLKPTLMTDSLVRKTMFGQGIGEGFARHPLSDRSARRSKLTRAEPGGWRPRPWRLRLGSTRTNQKRWPTSPANSLSASTFRREKGRLAVALAYNWQIGRSMSYWYRRTGPSGVRGGLRSQQVHACQTCTSLARRPGRQERVEYSLEHVESILRLLPVGLG